jgi:hypothetical protein
MAILANIFIDQHTDFSITVDVTDATGNVLNLTGYTAAAQMRKTYTSTNASATFSTVVSAPDGKVTLLLTDTVTGALEPGRYVYDMTVTSGSTTTRVIEGQAIVTPSVTR